MHISRNVNSRGSKEIPEYSQENIFRGFIRNLIVGGVGRNKLEWWKILQSINKRGILFGTLEYKG